MSVTVLDRQMYSEAAAARLHGQAVLTAPGEDFFSRIDWDGDEPGAWRPHDDVASPVRISPLTRFGRPAIDGISTEAIAGELDSGASEEEVAVDAQTKWGQLEVFMTQWRRIDALAAEPGPFVWRASRTTMTAIGIG